jgi:hypothetical protein
MISFTATCEDPDLVYGDELTFRWFSNISGELGEGSNIKNVLLSPGEHLISLIVSDIAGDKAFADIVLRSLAPDLPAVDDKKNDTTDDNKTKPDDKPDPTDDTDKSGGDKESGSAVVAAVIIILIILVLIPLLLFIMKKRKSSADTAGADVAPEHQLPGAGGPPKAVLAPSAPPGQVQAQQLPDKAQPPQHGATPTEKTPGLPPVANEKK